MRNLLKNEKGSSVIFELAFLLPVMIMIFYGFTMFTNGLAIDLAVKTAAREGAREYAITGNSSDGISKAMAELSASKVQGASVNSFTEGGGGSKAKVGKGIKVVKKYGFTIPFIGYYGPELTGIGIFVEEPPKK